MKEARFLIRLSNAHDFRPSDQGALLQKVRERAQHLGGKIINLRVSPIAIEFDLFGAPDLPLEAFFAGWQEIGEKLTAKRLDVPPKVIGASDLQLAEARELFNEQRFWEVHEVLEGLWKELKGPEKQLVQALILTAAALVHSQKGEMAVTWTMLSDALRRLQGQPDLYQGWDIARFRNHFAQGLASKELKIPTV